MPLAIVGICALATNSRAASTAAPAQTSEPMTRSGRWAPARMLAARSRLPTIAWLESSKASVPGGVDDVVGVKKTSIGISTNVGPR